MGAFFGFLGGLLGKLLGLWKAQPSRVEVVGREAAVAETKLSTVEAGNEAVARSVAAVRAVDDQLVRQPDAIREPDKYSRD